MYLITNGTILSTPAEKNVLFAVFKQRIISADPPYLSPYQATCQTAYWDPFSRILWVFAVEDSRRRFIIPSRELLYLRKFPPPPFKALTIVACTSRAPFFRASTEFHFRGGKKEINSRTHCGAYRKIRSERPAAREKDRRRISRWRMTELNQSVFDWIR